jgi:hypothetical protein
MVKLSEISENMFQLPVRTKQRLNKIWKFLYQLSDSDLFLCGINYGKVLEKLRVIELSVEFPGDVFMNTSTLLVRIAVYIPPQ